MSYFTWCFLDKLVLLLLILFSFVFSPRERNAFPSSRKSFAITGSVRIAKVILEEWYSRSRRPRTQMQQFILSRLSWAVQNLSRESRALHSKRSISASRGGMQKLLKLNCRKLNLSFSLSLSLLIIPVLSISAFFRIFPVFIGKWIGQLLCLFQPVGKWSMSIK